MALDSQKLKEYIGQANLIDHIDEETLTKMGTDIIDWFDDDEEARSDWKKRTDTWLKLASQVVEKKSFPWPNAANVKFPLITTAAMQFAARAYPALVPGPNLVQGLVIGRDEGGKKQQSAERVGRHMSYQLLFDMKGWEEDMDKLCLILPIIGCLFKKTYFDPVKKKNCSEVIMPHDLVIDYFAKSVDEATRKSHVIWRTKNEILERQRRKLFDPNFEITEPASGIINQPTKDKIDGTKEPKRSPATPHKFIECHTFWDLDEDDYDEPYIITVHYESRKVVRVVPRFKPEGIEENEDGEIISITPIEYFTKFPFIPNPDGGIYDVGFGLLLGGINETINTLTNQLLDSGTINNLQGGMLGRGIRLRAGGNVFQPGEWKSVDFTGDDIKKHIFPIPTAEPSEVLFKLLDALVISGKELASVAEIFVGKMPGQNTPATTTMATIEQGLKVFTAIYKRIYRALGQEYQKLFLLNSENLPDQKIYFTINEPTGPEGQEVEKQDYSPENLAVKPFADPNVVSSAQKLMKVQSYGALIELGTLNPQEYTKRFLEAVEAENITALMSVPPPQPTPEEKQMQAEMQMEQQRLQGDMQMQQVEAMIKKQDAQMKAQLEAMKAQMKQQEMEMTLRFKAAELQMKEREAQLKLKVASTEAQQSLELGQQEHEQAITQSKEQHSQKMEQGDAQHKQKLAQTKEKKTNGPSGANK